MELNLHCNVCGTDMSVEDIEAPIVIHGLMETWASNHNHSLEELGLYQETELEARNYAHSHKYADLEGDD